MSTIEFRDIHKTYKSGPSPVNAVAAVNLTVQEGEFFFLLGPSGCGKTTLLRLTAGLIEPTGGRLFFGDRDVTDLPVERRNTAMVFQSYALWPHMTVEGNVAYGPRMRGVGGAETKERVRTSLARVQMDGYEKRKPNQLSGGQQQRVAVARALAAKADLLLLDEPLSNLDARLRLHMRGELRRLVKESGTTAIYVTHDQKEALSMADRIAVMNAGRIVQVGTPSELYNSPASVFIADFLGEANFLEATVQWQQTRGPAGAGLSLLTAVGMLQGGQWRVDAQAPAPGRKVAICVRPERVAISAGSQADIGVRWDVQAVSDQASSGLWRIPAKIETSTYLGEARQYTCRLMGGQSWRVTVAAGTDLAGADTALPAGTAVTLSVNAADASVLPPD